MKKIGQRPVLKIMASNNSNLEWYSLYLSIKEKEPSIVTNGSRIRPKMGKASAMKYNPWIWIHNENSVSIG